VALEQWQLIEHMFDSSGWAARGQAVAHDGDLFGRHRGWHPEVVTTGYPASFRTSPEAPEAGASLWTFLLAAQEALEFGGEFVAGGKTRGRRQLVIERGLETAHQHPVLLIIGDDLVNLACNAGGRGM
jgi:hypothetical protein